MFVVFGATGATGQSAVQELLERGAQVRVAVRDPARVAALPPEVERVQADLCDGDSVAAALEGAHGVYAAVGGPTGSPQLADLMCGLIDAAKHAGVRRFVHVSGIDAHRSGRAQIQRWHQQIHRHLDASGMERVTLEPTFFLQNFLGLAPAIASGVLPLPAGQGLSALIDARDIGEVGAHVLMTPGHAGAIYTLTGPELLSHHDAAAILSRELGHSVQYLDLPAEAFCAQLQQAGLPPWFAELLADVYATVLAPGHAARATDDVARLLGRPPRSCATFIQDYRAALGG